MVYQKIAKCAIQEPMKSPGHSFRVGRFVSHYRILLILLLVSLPLAHTWSQVAHQPVGIHSGPAINEYDENSFRLVALDSVSVYTVQKQNLNFVLRIFNKITLEQVRRITLPLPPGEKLDYQFQKLISRPDTLFIFYYSYDQERKLAWLDLITLTCKDEVNLGCRRFSALEAKRSSSIQHLDISYLEDTDELTTLMYIQGKDSACAVLDQGSLRQMEKQTYQFRLPPLYSWFADLDDEGRYFQVACDNLKLKKAKWNLIVCSTGRKAATLISLPLLSSHQVFLTAFKSYSEKNTTHLFAAYSDKPDMTYAKGIYCLRFNAATGTVLSEKTIPFASNGQSFSMPACFLKYVFHTASSTKLVFESRSRMMSTLMFVPIDEYDAGNMLTIDLDSNDSIVDFHNIKKDQHTNSSNFRYSSFVALNGNIHPYLIYNELPVNLERTPDKMRQIDGSLVDETTIIYAAVDNGKVIRKAIVPKKEDGIIDALLFDQFLTEPNNREAILLRHRGKEVCLTRIWVEDSSRPPQE